MIYYIHSTAHMSQHNTTSWEYFFTKLTELAELTELTVTIVLTENLKKKKYESIICNSLKAKTSNKKTQKTII